MSPTYLAQRINSVEAKSPAAAAESDTLTCIYHWSVYEQLSVTAESGFDRATVCVTCSRNGETGRTRQRQQSDGSLKTVGDA